MTRLSVWLGNGERDPRRDVRLDHPGDHVHRGPLRREDEVMPTARDFCARRMTASSTSCGEIIARSASCR